jgi:uncharacterized membrane protein
MEYTEEALAKLSRKHGFRLRGLDMTRLETFLDAAFAFATTMLVISIDHIPGNYTELITVLKGIPAFGASFAIMMFFWVSHRKWSRYYGLEDGPSIFISLLLIFVLLVYIYPLKLMFSALFAWMSNGWFPSQFELEHPYELTGLFFIYGFGVAAMGALMALLYRRAKAAQQMLKLNQLELVLTDAEIVTWSIMSLTGLVSALFAITMPLKMSAFAGFIYMTLPVTIPYISIHYDRKAKSLLAETDDAEKA